MSKRRIRKIKIKNKKYKKKIQKRNWRKDVPWKTFKVFFLRIMD